MDSERKKSNSRSRSVAGSRVSTPSAPRAERHFAICVRNRGYRASLELRKLYPVLADAFADEHQMIRVVDESGEDYLYPSTYFVRVELPNGVERALHKIA
jgi:hypothetical protein